MSIGVIFIGAEAVSVPSLIRGKPLLQPDVVLLGHQLGRTLHDEWATAFGTWKWERLPPPSPPMHYPPAHSQPPPPPPLPSPPHSKHASGSGSNRGQVPPSPLSLLNSTDATSAIASHSRWAPALSTPEPPPPPPPSPSPPSWSTARHSSDDSGVVKHATSPAASVNGTHAEAGASPSHSKMQPLMPASPPQSPPQPPPLVPPLMPALGGAGGKAQQRTDFSLYQAARKLPDLWPANLWAA